MKPWHVWLSRDYLSYELRVLGIVSDSNFSTPLLLDYVAGPSDISSGLGGSNEGDMKFELRKSKRDSKDAWQVIDFGEQAKSVPTLLTPEPKREGKPWLY